MKQTWESTKVQVYFNIEGDQDPEKQTISDVKEEATDEEILEFGKILEKLAPATAALDSVVSVKSIRLSE